MLVARFLVVISAGFVGSGEGEDLGGGVAVSRGAGSLPGASVDVGVIGVGVSVSIAE